MLISEDKNSVESSAAGSVGIAWLRGISSGMDAISLSFAGVNEVEEALWLLGMRWKASLGKAVSLVQD